MSIISAQWQNYHSFLFIDSLAKEEIDKAGGEIHLAAKISSTCLQKDRGRITLANR
jgi:hypothetical protein